jgi:hypothetical protein
VDPQRLRLRESGGHYFADARPPRELRLLHAARLAFPSPSSVTGSALAGVDLHSAEAVAPSPRTARQDAVALAAATR